jgi:glycosyltransferase involved in cell wall biosynthesis
LVVGLGGISHDVAEQLVSGLSVQLIAKRDSMTTGLSRYGDTLMRHLADARLEVTMRFADYPMPELTVKLGRRLGWDVRAFWESYPLWGSLAGGDLHHLTSETLATLLLISKKRPTIVTVHGLLSYLLRDDRELSTHNHQLDRWFDSLAVRGLHRADAIIAVSSYLRTVLVEQVGLDPDRIHVVPEAVDHSVFRPLQLPDAFRRQHMARDGCRYILYVGSEQPRKNFLALLRAFARLQKRVQDVHLWKIGQPEIGHERTKALKLIEELDIGGSVTFIGHVGENLLPYFYNASDVFVFPSLYEGFGFPPLEAMACGTPVICSDRTSLPEVVGDAALLVDPTDEESLMERMESLLLDAELHEEYSRRGPEHARGFRWDVTAERTIDVYRHVLGIG